MILDDDEIKRLSKRGMSVMTDDGKAVLKYLKNISDTLKDILKKPNQKIEVGEIRTPEIKIPQPILKIEPNINVQPPEVNLTIPESENEKPIKKWQFVVEREYDGRIKTVTATAIE